MGSWTEEDPRIGAPRLMMTDRAGRWVTEQVGRLPERHRGGPRTRMRLAHRERRSDRLWRGPARRRPGAHGAVSALGLDEVLMVRVGPFHRQEFSTQIVDVQPGQLLDVVPGRAGEPMAWLAEPGRRRDSIDYGTLDLSGPYRRSSR